MVFKLIVCVIAGFDGQVQEAVIREDEANLSDNQILSSAQQRNAKEEIVLEGNKKVEDEVEYNISIKFNQ